MVSRHWHRCSYAAATAAATAVPATSQRGQNFDFNHLVGHSATMHLVVWSAQLPRRVNACANPALRLLSNLLQLGGGW